MDKIDKIILQVKFEKKRNWLKARKILTNALQEYPDNIKLLFNLAMLYQSKKVYKKAIEHYQQLLQQEPENEKAIFQISNCFLFSKEYHLAIDYMQRIKNPQVEVIYNKAYAHSHLHNIDKSINELEKLNLKQVRTEIPLIFLSELHFSKRNYKKSISLLDQAEKRFGKRSTIHYLRGLNNINQKNFLKAYLELSEAEKMQLTNPHFYRNYAIAANQIGKSGKAVEILQNSIKENPFDVNSYVDLIRLYVNLQQTDEAIAISKQAKKIFPYSVSLAMLLDKLKK